MELKVVNPGIKFVHDALGINEARGIEISELVMDFINEDDIILILRDAAPKLNTLEEYTLFLLSIERLHKDESILTKLKLVKALREMSKKASQADPTAGYARVDVTSGGQIPDNGDIILAFVDEVGRYYYSRPGIPGVYGSLKDIQDKKNPLKVVLRLRK